MRAGLFSQITSPPLSRRIMTEGILQAQATNTILQAIQKRPPAVHCLTNTVVQALTANMLLAVGAHPSMSSDIIEIADFVRNADALLINLGTLDDARKEAIGTALQVANATDIPWILDPVLVDRAPARLAYAHHLIKKGPSVIRGNAGEISALADDPACLARAAGAIVAVTGAIDLVTDGKSEITCEGGHALMSRVTGIGCAGTALIAAFCAIVTEDERLDAVMQALEFLGTAGEEAAKLSPAPGGFAAAILDQIYLSSQSST